MGHVAVVAKAAARTGRMMRVRLQARADRPVASKAGGITFLARRQLIIALGITVHGMTREAGKFSPPVARRSRHAVEFASGNPHDAVRPVAPFHEMPLLVLRGGVQCLGIVLVQRRARFELAARTKRKSLLLPFC